MTKKKTFARAIAIVQPNRLKFTYEIYSLARTTYTQTYDLRDVRVSE